MPDDVKRELDEAIERILASKSPKRLVVAGPGAGKTTVSAPRNVLRPC
jgi:superfamily I DNA/RNA helicase